MLRCSYVLIEHLILSAIRFSLLLFLLLFELHVPMIHHSTCQLVGADFLISSEAKNINGSLFLHRPNTADFFLFCLDIKNLEIVQDLVIMKLSTYIRGNELLHIIDTLDSDFTLADHWIVMRVGGDEHGLYKELM